MKYLLRIGMFIITFVLSIGLALTGCDGEKNDNNKLLLLLVNNLNSKIFIFPAGKLNDADFKTAGGGADGREGADNLCKAAASPGGAFSFLSGKTIKAFISVSGTDQIKDVVPPAFQELPVYGIKSNGVQTLLKSSWTGLWNNTGIEATMNAATGIDSGWWNGSNVDGTYKGDNSSCSQWTSSSSTNPPIGEGGNHTQTNFYWIDSFNATCGYDNFLLCVAY